MRKSTRYHSHECYAIKRRASHLNEFLFTVHKQAIEKNRTLPSRWVNQKSLFLPGSVHSVLQKRKLASSEVKALARLKMEAESGGLSTTSFFPVENLSSVSAEKEEGDEKGQHPDFKISSHQLRYTVIWCTILHYMTSVRTSAHNMHAE